MRLSTLARPARRLTETFGDFESAAIARMISGMMHDGVAVQDPVGRIVYCNDKAAELLSLRTSELLDRSSMDGGLECIALDGAPYPGERHPAMQAIATGIEVREEVMGVRSRGTGLRWLSVHSTPIELEAGRHAITVFTDITAAMEGDRQLHELRSDLRERLIQRDLPSTNRLRFAAGYRASGHARLIGGDFYGAYETAPDEVAFFLGDVCGHGVGSAGVSSAARSAVRALAPVLDDPAEVLGRLHAVLEHDHPTSFLTAVYGRVSAPPTGTATVRLCCAGHPLPLLVRDGETSSLGVTAPLVGMVANLTREVTEYDLRSGDRLVVYSDGVLDDAMPRLDAEELAQRLPIDLGLTETVDWLMEVAAARCDDDADHADDASVLAFEIR